MLLEYIYTPGGKDRGFLEYWETWPLLRSRRLQRHRGVQSPGGHDHLQFQGSKIIIIIFHYPKKKILLKSREDIFFLCINWSALLGHLTLVYFDGSGKKKR